jgi:hypothetical protein
MMFVTHTLVALTTGQRVMVLYDDGTSNCYGMQIAIGGFQGQC